MKYVNPICIFLLAILWLAPAAGLGDEKDELE